MKRFSQFLYAVIIFLAVSSCQNKFNPETDYSIIPQPYSLREGFQAFTLNKETRILISGDDIAGSAKILQEYIQELAELKLDIVLQKESKSLQNVILLSTVSKEKRLGVEGYRMHVDRDKVLITSNDVDGVFYGIQTILQLFEIQYLEDSSKRLVIPAIQIWDEPRFSYRGMHLDVARHFFDVDFVKRYLDIMAYYKFNTFHWHLTEDQGWRIEIKKYPKLTELGAWRTEEDGSRYGGFYTQEEIKEVVAYAEKLHITIIPEIEMPGHSRAALYAYPELSCTGEKQDVPNHWGVFKDIYCAGNEKTFEFIENVLAEVIDLFPGDYIHIGGDEAPKDRWVACVKCQARMQKEGLENEHELQSYFIKRIDKYLSSKGKKLMGWDEILEGGLAENATVMSWRGMDGGIAAARQGNQVVMTPGTHCYFDHYQADRAFEPKAIGGYTSLKKVYEFEPVPEDLFTEQKELILGVQGNVWTEYMHTTDQVEYMILPRMLALSEVLWGKKEAKNWSAFQERLQDHFKLFDEKGYRYSKGTYRLRFETSFDSIENQKKVEVFTEQYKAKIYYALNGLEPDTTSSFYEGLFPISEHDSIIRAGIFENGKLVRALSTFELSK
jgi:hexosaminidase